MTTEVSQNGPSISSKMFPLEIKFYFQIGPPKKIDRFITQMKVWNEI